MSILGLDIGGANIKAANEDGHAVSRPFAIWKAPEKLSEQIHELRREFADATTIAITMTAELADCFTTKAEGVRFILDQVSAASEHVEVMVWTTEDRFVSVTEGCINPMAVAAANWHALATWVGRLGLPGNDTNSASLSTLLIDIGTTTTDIIPIVRGLPVPKGLTDIERLRCGELCYSGVKRTPLCAIVHSVPFRDGYCTVAAELFATTLDAYLLLGEILENKDDHETANGKPATVDAAHDRIARVLCGDRQEVSLMEAQQIARFIADVQRQRLAGAVERVRMRLPEPCEAVVISGSGSFLARRLVAENERLKDVRIHSLDDLISPKIAEAACAFAVARLAATQAPTNDDR